MEVEQQLTNKELRKNIFVIVWPVFVEVLLGALFGMVDMMMVGKVPGDTAAAVSAVGMTNQPMFLGLSLIQALNELQLLLGILGRRNITEWEVS